MTLAVGLVGCGDNGVDLDKARAFRDYDLYYLGEEFLGEKLTATPGVGEFIYGDCDPGGGFGEVDPGGCAPPIDVQNYSICERGAESLADSELHAQLIRLPGGALARWRGGGLEVYTGKTTVVIFSDAFTGRDTFPEPRPKQLLAKERRFVEGLRPVGGKRLKELPPPNVPRRQKSCPAP